MKKISLTGSTSASRAAPVQAPASTEVLELFFNTGVAYHPVVLPSELPDVVASFVVMKDAAGQSASVRRAEAAEDPDVEISILEHIQQLSLRWIPVPYQLSSGHAVQIYLAPTGGRRGAVKAILAIDTLEHAGSKGRFLDAALDEGRPFRPLEQGELGGFLDHAVTRDYLRKVERAGLDAAPFKLSALFEVIAPYLPRIRFSRVDSHTPIPVSLVLDFGNSRTTAVLVEAREKGLLSIPLELRSGSDPFTVTEEAFDSRITFQPSPFEDDTHPLATGEAFTIPSVAVLSGVVILFGLVVYAHMANALDDELDNNGLLAATLAASPEIDSWERNYNTITNLRSRLAAIESELDLARGNLAQGSEPSRSTEASMLRGTAISIRKKGLS